MQRKAKNSLHIQDFRFQATYKISRPLNTSKNHIVQRVDELMVFSNATFIL